MVLKIRIGIGICHLTVDSKSDKSARIDWIESKTRIFLAEAYFVIKNIKNDKNNMSKNLCQDKILHSHNPLI